MILAISLILMVYSPNKGNIAKYPGDQLQMKNNKNAESLGQQVSSELSSNDNPPILSDSFNVMEYLNW
ncbi:hypothetical protein [Clostridium sp.]